MSLFKRVLNKNHVIGAAVAAVVLITPAVAFAATAYVSAAVNIRSGPGANYARLAALPAGAAVNAGSCRNGWCQVYNGNGTGWVSARYIRFGSYGGQAYAAPSTTTVVVDNGYYDSWAPGFGAGLGVGWPPAAIGAPAIGDEAGAAARTTTMAASAVTASPGAAGIIAGIRAGASAPHGGPGRLAITGARVR